MTHQFSGKYFYDKESKTAYLKYDKSANQLVKNRKQQLKILIKERDSSLIIKNDWENSEDSTTQISITPNNFGTFETEFKIEKVDIAKEKQITGKIKFLKRK